MPRNRHAASISVAMEYPDDILGNLVNEVFSGEYESGHDGAGLTILDIGANIGSFAVWAALRVTWLLESLPGVGKVRADKVITSLGIAPSRRIQGLGTHQRAALLAELEREGR